MPHVSSPKPACRTAVRSHSAAASTACPPVSHAQSANRKCFYSGVAAPGLLFHSHSRAEHRLGESCASAVWRSRRASAIRAAADSETAAQLSDEEQRAQRRFLDQAPGTVSAESIADAALTLLGTAASTRQVDQELVLGALGCLEGACLRRAAPPGDLLLALEGKWRLVYSSGTAAFLRYIPVEESFSIAIALRSVALSSDIGLLHTSFDGTFSWRDPNDMDFTFTHTLVCFSGIELINKAREGSPKTWTFFHVGPNIAAARSSAGGLNLMRRESAFAAGS